KSCRRFKPNASRRRIKSRSTWSMRKRSVAAWRAKGTRALGSALGLWGAFPAQKMMTAPLRPKNTVVKEPTFSPTHATSSIPQEPKLLRDSKLKRGGGECRPIELALIDEPFEVGTGSQPIGRRGVDVPGDGQHAAGQRGVEAMTLLGVDLLPRSEGEVADVG